MKVMVAVGMVLSGVLVGWGETFQMDRKGETTVEVTESSGEYRVTCRFKAQTKFDDAVNAKFNDAKGDSLCKRGLARFLNVATNETLAVSGQYSAAPVRAEGERLCYTFGVPVSGCSVEKVEPKPVVVAQPVAEPVAPAMPVMPVVTPAMPVVAPDVPVIAPTNAVPEATTNAVPEAAGIARTSTYVCVAKYREVNGKRAMISQQEYKRCSFRSASEFDRFCRKELARVRAKGEANLRAVRKAR